MCKQLSAKLLVAGVVGLQTDKVWKLTTIMATIGPMNANIV